MARDFSKHDAAELHALAIGHELIVAGEARAELERRERAHQEAIVSRQEEISKRQQKISQGAAHAAIASAVASGCMVVITLMQMIFGGK